MAFSINYLSWSISRALISFVYAHDSQTVAPALIFPLDSRVLLPSAYLISTLGCLIIVKSEISTNSWILPSKILLYTNFRQWHLHSAILRHKTLELSLTFSHILYPIYKSSMVALSSKYTPCLAIFPYITTATGVQASIIGSHCSVDHFQIPSHNNFWHTIYNSCGLPAYTTPAVSDRMYKRPAWWALNYFCALISCPKSPPLIIYFFHICLLTFTVINTINVFLPQNFVFGNSSSWKALLCVFIFYFSHDPAHMYPPLVFLWFLLFDFSFYSSNSIPFTSIPLHSLISFIALDATWYYIVFLYC